MSDVALSELHYVFFERLYFFLIYFIKFLDQTQNTEQK